MKYSKANILTLSNFLDEPISFPGFLGLPVGFLGGILEASLFVIILSSQKAPRKHPESTQKVGEVNWFVKKITYLKKFSFR